MSADGVLRPAATGLGAKLTAFAFDNMAAAFAILRAVRPVLRMGTTWMVTRADDVREVLLTDTAFMVPYKAKLDVIMGGEPFFLGMENTPEYRRDIASLRAVVRPADLPSRLIPAMAARAEAIVAASKGELEVVDTLARQATFDVLNDYFGIASPASGDLRVWATRLFEFQFIDQSNDPALRAEVDTMAPALRAHVDGLIAARRASPTGQDDVLGRCLAAQLALPPGTDARSAGYADTQIRSYLIGLLVGGLPQPPMAVPQALEQLLRRPDALAQAQYAARQDDDRTLAGCVFEALRFDPLAPAVPRTATRAITIAAGTAREATIPAGAAVLASVASAMRDPRRVADPGSFDPSRPSVDFMHFGLGLHQCFGLHINMALIPLMLKPLLRRQNVRRAPGPAGHLTKRGLFADRLTVRFDP